MERTRDSKKAKWILLEVVAVFGAGLMTLLALLFALPVQARVQSGVGNLDKTTAAPGESVTYTFEYSFDNNSSYTSGWQGHMKLMDVAGTVTMLEQDAINLGDYTHSGGTDVYTHVITAPATPDVYAYYIDTTMADWLPNAMGEVTLTVQADAIDNPPAPAADPGPAPENPYDTLHYGAWLPVLADPNALGNSGTLTVEMPVEIDHIRHFVFDAPNGTNRTLVVVRNGVTYCVNGQKLGSIAPGHNHVFELLERYKV